jgi:protein-disulfide isomerase/uncharacterized membrane protein
MMKIRLLLTLFAAVALVASVLSLNVHYQLLTDSSYTSFCDVSETVSCEAVYQSAYGTVRGVPVASGGVIWSTLVLLLVWWGMRRPQSEPAKEVGEYVFLLAVIGLAVVLYYGYASYFVLQKVCLLCTATYVGVFGVFFVSAGVTSMPFATLPARFVRDIRLLVAAPSTLVLTLLWLAGSGSLVAFFPREAAPPESVAPASAGAQSKLLAGSEKANFERWYAAQPITPVVVADDGALVVILKFNDYQCPPCRQTYLDYKKVLEKFRTSHPGQVKFVTRDFPLEAECNTGGPHRAACEAAAAVRMARQKGRAEALEDWLFDNQPAMNPDLVRQGVRQVAGVTDFDARYPAVLEQVKGDIRYAKSLGVNRTPTFFINGRKIEGGLEPEFFEAAIAYELAHAAP